MLECVIEEKSYVTALIKHCLVSWICAGILYFCAERFPDETPAMTTNNLTGIFNGISQYFQSTNSTVSQIRPCPIPSALFTNHLSLNAIQRDILAMSLNKR
jgi:hypothetical protein